MSALDDYKAYIITLEENIDEKGKFTKYRKYYEHPCGCHPETCSHIDGVEWMSKDFKVYEIGVVEYL